MSEEKSTTKKTKVIGTQEYLNTTTGELEEMQIIRMEDKDFDFEKIWLGQILSAIDEISNQKMRLLTHLLRIREKSNNTVIRTIRELEKETGVSKDTISRTLVVLERNKIIRRKTGVIFINPDVVFKGGYHNRMRILFEYKKISQEQQTDENIIEFPSADPNPIVEDGDILGIENAA
jgi:DNA-binding transcriptional regulator YhcF (GntR family)